MRPNLLKPQGNTLRRKLVFQRLFVRNSQFLASCPSARCQHPTTIGGSHSFAESVLILSLSFRWLVSPFHALTIVFLWSHGIARAIKHQDVGILMAISLYLLFT